MRSRSAQLDLSLLFVTVAITIECTIASLGADPMSVMSMQTGGKTAVWYGRGLRNLLNDCSTDTWNNPGQEDYFEKFRECVYHRALTAFDTVLNDDVIPLFDGLDLIKYPEMNNQDQKQKVSRENRDPVGSFRSGNLEEDLNWNSDIWNRVKRVLQSHVFKVDLNRLTDSIATDKSEGKRFGIGDAGTGSNSATAGDTFEGRRRRHRRRHHHMMPLMMMGLMLIGSILIPMGFQFLAVLGGKALLLAKMALLLSSIQGLKKIATSGVNYGLYHAPVAEGWHERSNQESGQEYDGTPFGSFANNFSNEQRPFR